MASIGMTGRVEAAKARPILWWATLGAGFLALQLYILASWILSDDFKPVAPGPDALSPIGAVTMWGVAVTFVGAAVGGIAWIGWSLARGRALSTTQILMVGCWTCLWQDATINLLRPVALYNTHYPNMGSWAEHIPFWFSPNGVLNAQPLTFQSSLYLVMIPLWVLTAFWVMKTARRLWPRLVMPQLILIAMAFITVAQTGAEVAMVRGEIFAYGGAIHALSVFPGTRWQFPVYGAFLWSIGTVALGALLLRRDQAGRTAVEQGIERLNLGTAASNGLRCLSMAGAANLAILAYYLPFMFVSLYSDPWPTDFPSYFRNGICGAETGYACPDPALPIPSRRVPPSPL